MTDLAFKPLSESFSYLWGWPGRAESAESIADRLVRMAKILAETDPAFGELRMFANKGRPDSAPEVMSALTTDDLARLIDRWARFNPPQRPAPVSAGGYWVVFGNGRRPSDRLYVSLRTHAGDYSDAAENAVELQVNPNGPLWQDREVVRRLFERGLSIWGAEWGAVWLRRADEEQVKQWPRLVWTADRFASHSIPPYWNEYPFPFPFYQPPATRTASPMLQGEFEEWTWP